MKTFRLYSVAFIILSTLFILQFTALAQEGVRKLTVADIYRDGGLTGRAPETVKWSPDGSKLSYVLRDDTGTKGELYYFDVKTGKASILVTPEKLASLAPAGEKIQNEREKERRSRYGVAGYHWSPDSQHMLFDANGRLWYFDLASGTAKQVTSTPEPIGDPKFSPDGKRLAFARKHNLFVHDLASGKETALTATKDENLLNGEVDWVYAEELDGRSNYFWSPDGSEIAYLQMDESAVPEYPIEDFLPLHPAVDKQKYPKVGDPNPKVRVGVVSAKGGTTRWITLPESNDEVLIPRFGWVRPGILYVEVMNRVQTKLDLYFVDAATGKSRLMLTENEDKAWVEVEKSFRVLQSGSEFLWTSWRDGFTHLYLYSFDKNAPFSSNAKLVRQLTHGDWEVMSVDSVDEAKGMAFITTNRTDLRDREFDAVKLDGTFLGALEVGGTHSVSFSEDGKNYVDSFSSLLAPPKMRVCGIGKEQKPACAAPFWSSREVTEFGALLEPKMVEFKAEDGTTLYGTLLLPPNASSTNQAPVLMNPYGGPGAQLVRNTWGGVNYFFDQILARKGIAVLRVDNRGMAARGKKFATALRRNFGEVELKDQLSALHQALERYPELDGKRMGWWGWSYGGYMTLMALTHSDLFKAGVSVAPVTDFHNYDTIYTERYMGLYGENAAAYQRSAPITHANQLHGKLLLVHGTGDDNVHMQNTIQMMQKFIDADKQFDLMLYPRKTHGIAGSSARTHLFERIQQHFETELLGKSAE